MYFTEQKRCDVENGTSVFELVFRIRCTLKPK